MPTLADLNRRYSSLQNSVENVVAVSESFVDDFRSSITPAQAVETKLGNVLLRKAFGRSSSRRATALKPR
jgi:hypothetical protein